MKAYLVNLRIDLGSSKAYLVVGSMADLVAMIEVVYSRIKLAVKDKITEETLVIVIVLHLQTLALIERLCRTVILESMVVASVTRDITFENKDLVTSKSKDLIASVNMDLTASMRMDLVALAIRITFQVIILSHSCLVDLAIVVNHMDFDSVAIVNHRGFDFVVITNHKDSNFMDIIKIKVLAAATNHMGSDPVIVVNHTDFDFVAIMVLAAAANHMGSDPVIVVTHTDFDFVAIMALVVAIGHMGSNFKATIKIEVPVIITAIHTDFDSGSVVDRKDSNLVVSRRGFNLVVIRKGFNLVFSHRGSGLVVSRKDSNSMAAVIVIMLDSIITMVMVLGKDVTNSVSIVNL